MTVNNSNNCILSKVNYRNSAVPTWVSSTQISLKYVIEKAQSNNCNIISKTPLTLTTTTVGANGILVSANLTGTAAYSNSTQNVTGTGTNFLVDFVPGDVIQVSSGECRRILSISGSTTLKVESVFSTSNSGSYKLGGKAKNCSYYLYVISQANGLNPALALCTRSVSYGHSFLSSTLPSTYTEYRELPFSVYLDSSQNIYEFFVAEGWPYAPVIMYQPDHNTANDLRVISGTVSATSAASAQTIDCTAFVPLTASSILLSGWQASNGHRLIIVEPTGTSTSCGFDLMDTGYSTVGQATAIVGKPSSSCFQIYGATSTDVRALYVDGYTIDNVY